MKTQEINKIEKLIAQMNELYFNMNALNKELQINLRNKIEETNKKYSIALARLDYLPKQVSEIYNAILKRNDLTIHELFYNENITPIVMCRHEIHYVLQTLYAKKKNDIHLKEFYMTLADISELTGKTHSMALNSVRVINNELDTQPKYKYDFMEFFNSLKF